MPERHRARFLPFAGALPTVVTEMADLPVVALIASAGGLAPMTSVLHQLPPDFRGAIVALLHQQPDRPSQLTAILARRCALTVRQAADGDALEPGIVLVVPPGRHALVTADFRICLVRTDHFPSPRPSGDVLLCTLAVSAGPAAIAVILSGGGHDGAIGVQAIDALGGTVVVQRPGPGVHAGMPLAALGANRPKFLLKTEDIGACLLHLVGDGNALGDEALGAAGTDG